MASRVWAEELIVGLDYGQFDLSGYDYLGEVPDFQEIDVLHAALEGSGIAQHGDYLVILSPHQTNLEMSLAIEIWDEQPAGEDADEADWPEAFEANLNIGRNGLRYSSPTIDAVTFSPPPGAYRALITGRGFVAHGWPGSSTPGDNWRIQLWSADPASAIPARRLRDWKHSIIVDVGADGEPTRIWRASIPHTVVGVQYASRAPDGRRFYRLDVQSPAGASMRADVFGPNVDQPGRWELQSWWAS
jgi:hypothetical protein